MSTHAAREFLEKIHEESFGVWGDKIFDRLIEAANHIEGLLGERALLRGHLSKQNEEISQIAGKAIGYPWYKDDLKNFPGAVEADGVCVGDHVAESIVQELANAYTAHRQHIKSIHVSMVPWCHCCAARVPADHVCACESQDGEKTEKIPANSMGTLTVNWPESWDEACQYALSKVPDGLTNDAHAHEYMGLRNAFLVGRGELE